MENSIKGSVMRAFIATVDKIEVASNESRVFGRDLIIGAGYEYPGCRTLYLKRKHGDSTKIEPDNVVDLSDDGIEHFYTKESEVSNYEVDGEPETTDKSSLTPLEIMRLKGVNSERRYLLQLLPNGTSINYAYRISEPITMKCAGMTFITEKWLDSVRISDFGKNCSPLPVARTYIIRIDKKEHPWSKPQISKQELIALETPVDPNKVELYKFLSSSPKPIRVDDVEIDLTEKCLVRFVIQPKDQQDGKTIRREFVLPIDDQAFLIELGLPWQTVSNLGSLWVLIENYPIPDGYNVSEATVALMIPPSYPATQIDMAYFYPPLSKSSGSSIPNLLEQNIEGLKFQCWSRHRQADEWKPGVDDISTHLCLVDSWLLKDLLR